MSASAQIVEIECNNITNRAFVNFMSDNDVVDNQQPKKVLAQLSFYSGGTPIYATLLASFSQTRLLSNFTTTQLLITFYTLVSTVLHWNKVDSIFFILETIWHGAFVLNCFIWLQLIINIGVSVLYKRPLQNAAASCRPIDAAIYEHERTVDLNDYYSFNTRSSNLFANQTVQINAYIHVDVVDFVGNLCREILTSCLCLFVLQLPFFFAVYMQVPEQLTGKQLHLTSSIASALITFYGTELMCGKESILNTIMSIEMFLSACATLICGWLLISTNSPENAVMWFLWSAICRAVAFFDVRVKDENDE